MGSCATTSSVYILTEPNIKIEYDKYGRMHYNPEFHSKSGTLWNQEDLQYLIDWYDIAGPEEMAFALERTVKTVQMKVTELRKKGVMVKPSKIIHHKRLKKESS